MQSLLAMIFPSNLDMPVLCARLLVAFHRLQDLEAHICSRTSKVLASINKPLESAYEQNNAKGDNAVV